MFEKLNFFFGHFMLHDLADKCKEISAIKKFCQNQSSSIGDWKVLAQKVSQQVGQRHYVEKSDSKQLCIICLSQ